MFSKGDGKAGFGEQPEQGPRLLDILVVLASEVFLLPCNHKAGRPKLNLGNLP